MLLLWMCLSFLAAKLHGISAINSLLLLRLIFPSVNCPWCPWASWDMNAYFYLTTALKKHVQLHSPQLAKWQTAVPSRPMWLRFLSCQTRHIPMEGELPGNALLARSTSKWHKSFVFTSSCKELLSLFLAANCFAIFTCDFPQTGSPRAEHPWCGGWPGQCVTTHCIYTSWDAAARKMQMWSGLGVEL